MTPINASFDLGEDYPDDTFNQRGYRNEKGLPKLCRLDFRITNLDELKRASFHLDQLNNRIKVLAFNESKLPLLARIFHARAAMAECQALLKEIRPKQERMSKKYHRDESIDRKPNYGRDTTSSVWAFGDHWKMNRLIQQGEQTSNPLITKETEK